MFMPLHETKNYFSTVAASLNAITCKQKRVHVAFGNNCNMYVSHSALTTKCMLSDVEFNDYKADLKKELRNRRRRARTRKLATGTVTLGSRTTTTESGEGPCGRSGSESDIREYDLWVKRDVGDVSVSCAFVVKLTRYLQYYM